MIRILYREGNNGARGAVPVDATLEQLPDLLARCQAQGGLLWVDARQATSDEASPEYAAEHAEIERVLRDVFAFHPLAVDDALIETHVPKLDDWDTYLYLVLHAVIYEPDLDQVDTRELDIFLGRNYLVTYHVEDIPALEHEWRALQRDERHSRRGVDYLLYELCDAIAADYLPCIDAIDEALDKVQDEMFERQAPGILQNAFRIKRAVAHLRRILNPQREVLNKLARDDFDVIDDRDRIYFRDVYDHYVRMADLNESLRDIASGVLESYLSVTANRTNQVMKALTIITTLFMPLSFITGLFGMNFFGGSYEVNLAVNPAALFGITLAVMAAIPVAMIWTIRKRGWW
jgi:magnesium transporter